jgi:hypothetical protein
MRFVLADHVPGPLVFTEAKIDGVPHLAGARPFGKLYLGDEQRFDPGRHSFILHLPGERRFGRFKLDELAMNLLKRGMAEASADMPDIAPPIAFADRKDEGSEKWTCFLRSCKACDHHFLTLRGFDLEPIVCPGAR